jgi:hypothetical protein
MKFLHTHDVFFKGARVVLAENVADQGARHDLDGAAAHPDAEGHLEVLATPPTHVRVVRPQLPEVPTNNTPTTTPQQTLTITHPHTRTREAIAATETSFEAGSLITSSSTNNSNHKHKHKRQYSYDATDALAVNGEQAASHGGREDVFDGVARPLRLDQRLAAVF